VRALNPHIGAYLELEGGDRLGVAKATTDAASAGEGIEIATSDGALYLLEVRPAGGRAMDAASYLRGHAVPKLA
jgi:methionyl-tRNA formyltransferase